MVDFVLAIFQNVIAMVPYDWYKTKFARRSYHSSPHQVKASFLDRLNGPERGNPYIKDRNRPLYQSFRHEERPGNLPGAL